MKKIPVKYVTDEPITLTFDSKEAHTLKRLVSDSFLVNESGARAERELAELVIRLYVDQVGSV